LAGGSGFFLAVGDDAGAYALFTFHAAVLLAFLSIITASWAGRVRPLAFTVLVVIFAWLIYPLAASWAWGGGWLAALGHTRGLGHGFIDPGGAGVVQLMAGAVVLGGSLLWGRLPKPATLATGRDGADAELPPLALAGALTMGMGWLALLAGDALLVGASLPQVLVNAVTSAGWATATAMGYMGFTTGRADGAMAARGMLAGIFAASAAAAFVSPPAAALIGAVAGLLVCLSTYAVAHSLRLDDPLHAVAVHGVSGLWGLVALGLFAEGRTGAGWNGVGLREYLGGVGQGVTGLLPAAGFVADPAQLVAQLVGAGVLVTWALTPALVLVKVVQRWANAREAVSLASHDEGAA
jgi:Amt family ammonium transporter